MAIQGLRSTADFITNERPENWRQGLLLLYPNSAQSAKAPLTALSSLMKSESTDDPVFHWWEKELDTQVVYLAQTLGTAAGTLELTLNVTVDPIGAMRLVEGTILMSVETREQFYVVADPTSAAKVIVQRAWGGSTATALDHDADAVDVRLLIIGQAYEEGSLSPTGQNFDPVEKYNYTQIFRRTYGLTRTARKTKLRTEDAIKEHKREALEYIGIQMERAFFWGRRASTVKNGEPLRTTGGLHSFLPTANKIDFEGVVDMDKLEEEMEKIFRFGASEKMFFGGNKALSALNSAVRKNTNYQVYANEKEYGLNVTKFQTPFGVLVFRAHPLFTQIGPGTNPTTTTTSFGGESSSGFIIDMGNLKYRYIDDLRHEDNLQVPGQDANKAGYLAECGYEIHHAKTHFYWYGLDAGAADSA